MTENKNICYNEMGLRSNEPSNLSSAEIIVPLLIKYINPKSVLDIGCATGIWLSQFKKYGIKVKGIDGEWVHNYKKFISEDEVQYYDFESEKKIVINEKYDLVLCLEMAEHVSAGKADYLVDVLTSASDFIYFSAATPNSGGQHHINERWQSFWRAKFKKRGYVLIDAIRPEIYTNKKCCYFYAQESFIYMNEEKLDKYPILEKMICDKILIDIVHPELFLNQIIKPSHEWNYLLNMQRKLLISMFKKFTKKL